MLNCPHCREHVITHTRGARDSDEDDDAAWSGEIGVPPQPFTEIGQMVHGRDGGNHIEGATEVMCHRVAFHPLDARVLGGSLRENGSIEVDRDDIGELAAQLTGEHPVARADIKR